jgi:hypothetical protein
MRKLTIGMCYFDDFDGVYFTVQALRLFHKEILNEIEWVFVDNNYGSPQSELAKQFITNHVKEPYKLIPFTRFTGTSLRNIIFEVSDTPYTLSTDCHVLFEPGSLKKLIQYYDEGHDDGNLLQGPLIYDSISENSVSTHFKREWGVLNGTDKSAGMLGKWGYDSRYVNSDSPPFEIECQGLGVFSCRTLNWLKFNSAFQGFGGEEFYIHDKYRINGKKVICLPFLGWVHRFFRERTPYPNFWEHRYRNYLIGRIELGQDVDDVEEAFKGALSEETKELIRKEVVELFNSKFEIKSCNCKGKGTITAPPSN